MASLFDTNSWSTGSPAGTLSYGRFELGKWLTKGLSSDAHERSATHPGWDYATGSPASSLAAGRFELGKWLMSSLLNTSADSPVLAQPRRDEEADAQQTAAETPFAAPAAAATNDTVLARRRHRRTPKGSLAPARD